MIKIILSILGSILLFFALPSPSFAQTPNPQVQAFSSELLTVLTIIASVFSVFVLIKGGYLYITSTGKPDALENAKRTIKHALIGLTLVLSASVFASLLSHAFTTPNIPAVESQIQLQAIEPEVPSGGLTQVLLEAVSGFLQSIIQSATKPITDAIIGFLTTTPLVSTNSVIFNFWLVILGIADALFVVVVALLGLQFMSASAFGFEELDLKHILPRLGLAFLGANVSIYFIDWIIRTSNVLVSAVLSSTGGINDAWILNAFDPANLSIGGTTTITLIFMVLFIILATVLLLFYISRLIIIAFGAAISPLIFLLWAIPKFSDFSEIASKTYLAVVFSVFVHVVIIQLASAFLSTDVGTGSTTIIPILVGIGLFVTLLKAQSLMVQFTFYNSGRAAVTKLGGQVINVLTAKQTESTTAETAKKSAVKKARKVIKA
ncbi:pilin [Patescibacteria group bacterium]|nr:pilin [Patescibacteria group bacterium]MBU1844364.1 pilin [Patescibacteria group bacterium]